jgi:hypothetical protein
LSGVQEKGREEEEKSMFSNHESKKQKTKNIMTIFLKHNGKYYHGQLRN